MSSAQAASPSLDVSLRQELEGLILEHLVDLQKDGLHEQAWQVLLETMDPRSNQLFEQSARANKRVARYHSTIRSAQKEGRIPPWIYPPGAAASFEGIWAAASLLWVNTPLPSDLGEVARPVRDLVSLEVGVFVAAIGGVAGLGWLWPGTARG